MAESVVLYLIRHAIAAERGDEWPDDTKRPLTEKGIERMRKVVLGLAALDPQVGIIFTSPLVRARQTADLLVTGLKPRPALDVLADLAPGGTPAYVAEAVAARETDGSVALVGHEPDLGELGAWLLGTKHPLVFKKGGVCRIDLSRRVAPGSGQLVWLATPSMLRGLA